MDLSFEEFYIGQAEVLLHGVVFHCEYVLVLVCVWL